MPVPASNAAGLTIPLLNLFQEERALDNCNVVGAPVATLVACWSLLYARLG